MLLLSSINLQSAVYLTYKTCNGDIIHGQVVILGTSLEAENFALLTKEQAEIIKAEIR
jgi:hypothetical protein